MAGGGLEFDWDQANIRHLKRHRITPGEFEEALVNEPLDLEYQTEENEERFKAVGETANGRILVLVWAIREGRIRAVTAYTASRPMRRLYREYLG